MTDVLTHAPATTALAPRPDAPSAPTQLADDLPASALAGTVAESLAVVVAPTTGRFHPHDGVGAVGAGGLIGHVTGGRGRADEVRSPVAATVRDLLVRRGQLVRAGQGLAWLDRTGRSSS